MATIKEIAERAGVSTTTVSNVIHGKTKKVSPATIDKIESLISEMGYVQKMGLRVLNNEKSQLIAVVVNYHKDFKDSVLGDPFYGKIIGFIEEYIQKQGYYMMICSTKDVEKIFQMVAGWDVDGVIAISFSRRNCEKIYQLIKKPIVSIDAYGELDAGEVQHVANIGLDDESGGYQMTKYLLTCGYEEIKICAGRDSGVDHIRYLGAMRAMKECGKANQSLQFVALGMNYEKRKSNYDWLMQRRRPGTALFFLSDMYALEAISFYAGRKLSVPEEIGVAGYDDISFAQYSTPRLTTVKQDVERKARLAVELVLKWINEGSIGEMMETQLPVALVKRESVMLQNKKSR